jgi:beta-N-acetylhexosaminidase
VSGRLPREVGGGVPAARGVPDALGRMMLAFDGMRLPAAMAERLVNAPAAGITLFRALNVETPAQVLALALEIQAAAARHNPDAGPLLVAADQEGGQFLALGDATTAFPGAMALGATGDPGLAERVGRATGLELLAMGVNTAYAPVCDLANNPANPNLGIRSFGSEPGAVAALVAATVRGLRASGVAVAAKHFPGLGDSTADTHHGLAVVARDRGQLEAAEFVPFRAAIAAGADLVMSAHVALPAVTGDPRLPSTLSRAVMHDLLRDDLGFDGLVITDALDMAAIPQGEAQADAVVAALRAGVDLLLGTADPVAQARIEGALRAAAARGALPDVEAAASGARLAALRRRLGGAPLPPLDTVDSAAHQALAREVAERSVTLVRDDAGLLPLRPAADARIVVVQSRPRDLTPADTSSYVAPLLAAAVARRCAGVESIVVDEPSDAEITAVRDRVAGADLLVLGTTSASLRPAEAALARALLDTGVPTVTIALRTPFDLAAYPTATTHACAYGVVGPAVEAIVAALFGEIGWRGRLPVAVPGLYPVGHAVSGAAGLR